MDLERPRERSRNLKFQFIPGWKEDFMYSFRVNEHNELDDLHSVVAKAYKYIFTNKCKKCGICDCNLSLTSDIVIVNKNLKKISQKTIIGDLMDSGETILYIHRTIYNPVKITFHISYPDDPDEKYNYIHKSVYTDYSVISEYVEDNTKSHYYKNNPKYNLMNIVPVNNNYKPYHKLKDYVDDDDTVVLFGKIQFRTTKQQKRIQDEKESKKQQEKQQLVNKFLDDEIFDDEIKYIQNEEFQYKNSQLYSDFKFRLNEEIDVDVFNITFQAFLDLHKNENITFSINIKEPVKLIFIDKVIFKSDKSKDSINKSDKSDKSDKSKDSINKSKDSDELINKSKKSKKSKKNGKKKKH